MIQSIVTSLPLPLSRTIALVLLLLLLRTIAFLLLLILLILTMLLTTTVMTVVVLLSTPITTPLLFVLVLFVLLLLLFVTGRTFTVFLSLALTFFLARLYDHLLGLSGFDFNRGLDRSGLNGECHRRSYRLLLLLLLLFFLVLVVLTLLLIDLLLDNFESNLQCFDFCPQFEEALMYLALQMHLDAFFSIIDSLDGSAYFADLIEHNLTFCCLTTASKLSPIRSISFLLSLSRSTSSRQRAESSICPFSPKISAFFIISSISLSMAKILSRICLGLSVVRLVLLSMVF